jgi:hypothetical protein
MDLGGLKIAQLVKGPREASLDLDEQRIVGPDRLECRAEDVGADAEPLLVRPHPAEEHERTRALGAVRPGRDLLQQRADTGEVSPLKVAFGSINCPPGRVVGMQRRGQTSGLLV